MVFTNYIDGLSAVLERIKAEQAGNIKLAGRIVADSISHDGVIHTFGTGHSHLIAEDAFFRAGGIASVNPILDERLIFLKGALESTRAERESGLALQLIEREDVREADAAIIISNSGRNAVPVEMALEMKKRGVKVIAITNFEQSRSVSSRHASGKKLYELADVAVDNCVPDGDALIEFEGLSSRAGASSTVAGSAIIHSIILEALKELLDRGVVPPVFQSANVEHSSTDDLRSMLRRYRDRIRYLDPETELD